MAPLVDLLKNLSFIKVKEPSVENEDLFASLAVPHRYLLAPIYNARRTVMGESSTMISARDNQLPEISRDLVTSKLNYANSAIPFLKAVVHEIDQLACEHQSIRSRLTAIDLHRHLDGNADLYSEEIEAVEEAANHLCDRLSDCYREMSQVKGVSFDADNPAFVDFPLETKFGSIHFCWKLGEARVANWHWSDEACDSRRQLSGFDEFTKPENSLMA